MALLSLLFGVFMLVWFGVDCYPSGAPTQACTNMVPEHGVSAQTIKPLYKVDLGRQRYYTSNKTIKGIAFYIRIIL